jgi:hypothetical protein
MKGKPHYTKEGKLFCGKVHKDADGKIMTGKSHTKDSVYLFHHKELSKKLQEKIDVKAKCKKSLN